MSEELKPCPFCGGEAYFGRLSGTHGAIKCRKCHASCELCESHAEAAARRNTRAQDQGVGTWQSIETAPRDGTHILVTKAGGGGLGYRGPINEHGFRDFADWCDVVHWFSDPYNPGFYSTSWGGDQEKPFDGLTHWMPLPIPPVGEE